MANVKKSPDIYPKGVDIHTQEMCDGSPCPFHNPSDHHMVDWTMNVRLDGFSYGLVERLCPHGIGHPDPDSVAWKEAHPRKGSAGTWGVHGCDGCCSA